MSILRRYFKNYSFSDKKTSLKAIHLVLESYASFMKKIQQLANSGHCEAIFHSNFECVRRHRLLSRR